MKPWEEFAAPPEAQQPKPWEEFAAPKTEPAKPWEEFGGTAAEPFKRSALGEAGVSVARGLAETPGNILAGGPVASKAIADSAFLPAKTLATAGRPGLATAAGLAAAAVNPAAAVRATLEAAAPSFVSTVDAAQRKVGEAMLRPVEKNLAADPARTGVGRFFTQTIPTTIGKLPMAAAGPIAPALFTADAAAANARTAEAEIANLDNLSPEQKQAYVAALSTVGGLSGLGGVARIAGRPLAQMGVTVAEQAGIGSAQVLGGAAARKAADLPVGNVGEELASAIGAALIVPTVGHGVKEGFRAQPEPLDAAALMKWAKETHPGRETKVEGDGVSIQMLDGRKVKVQMVPDIVPSPEQAQGILTSARARGADVAGFVDDALTRANGDAVEAVKILDAERNIGPVGNTRSMKIADEQGNTVRTDAVIDLLAGDATRGTLAEEEVHALIKLAGVDEAKLKELGKSNDLRQAEENFAAMISSHEDNAAKGFVRRFAERIFGRAKVDEAVLKYRDELRARVSGNERPSRVSEAWNARQAELERIIGRPMKSATPEEFERVSKLKQSDLFSKPEAKPQELPDTATPEQRKFAEIFWHKNTSVSDREAMLRAKAMGVADDLLSQFPLRSEGLTADESARLLAFNEKAKQGTLGLQGQQAATEPVEGPQRVVGSKFQQPQQTTTQAPSGTAPKFSSGEQQNLGGVPAQPAMPVFDRGAANVTEGGRAWKKLKFADPVDDLAYHLSRKMGDKRTPPERIAFLKGELARVAGLPPDQVDAHIAEVRQAVKDYTLAQPKGQEAATVPKLAVRGAQERAAAMQQAEAQRVAAIAAADAEAAQRRAAGEQQRAADEARRAQERAELDARLAAEAEQRRQAEAARRAEMDAVLARDDWRNELAKSADELEAGGGFGVGSGITKADAPALRAAAMGKQLTPKQFEIVQNFVKTVGEPRPVAEVTAEAGRGAEVPAAGGERAAEFQSLETTPDVSGLVDAALEVGDAIEPDVVQGGGAMPDESLPFQVRERRKQTDTPEFKRWFGNSKVVDEKGEPMLLFHGTKADFSTFDTDRAGQNYPNEVARPEGLYLSNDPKEAATAAMLATGFAGENVMPVYASLTNPLQVSIPLSGFEPSTYYDNYSERLQTAARDMEADGIIVRRVDGKVLVIATTPTQIKSATGNTGAFDPSNPDIRFQVRQRRERRSFAGVPGVKAARDAVIAVGLDVPPEKISEWQARGVEQARANPNAVLDAFANGKINAKDGAEVFAAQEVFKRGFMQALESGDAALGGKLAAAVGNVDKVGSYAGKWMRALRATADGYAPEAMADQMMRRLFKPSPKNQRLIESGDAAKVAEGQKKSWNDVQDVIEQWKREGIWVEGGVNPFGSTTGGGPSESAAQAGGAGRPGQETPAGAEAAGPAPTEAANVRGVPPEAAPVSKWGFAPRVLRDPQLAASAMRDVSVRRADWADAALEWQRNMMLSNVVGQIRNFAGSGLNVGRRQVVEWAIQSAMNSTRKAVGAKAMPNTATWQSMAHAYEEMMPIVAAAGRSFLKAWNTETSRYGQHFLDEGPNVAISGKKGRVIRMAQRLNLAADEFWMTVAAGVGLRERAFRLAEAQGAQQGLTDGQVRALAEQYSMQPPEALRVAAVDDAMELTFKGPVPEAFSAMIKMKQGNKHPMVRLMMGSLFPFVKTPVNVVRQGVRQFTPYGLIRMGMKAARGEYKGAESRLGQDAAEQILGAAIGTSVLALMMDEDEQGRPRVTGSMASSKDPGRRDFQGNLIPPRSIRIGDKWVSYSGVEPLATTLQAFADMFDTARNAKNFDSSAAVMGRFMKNAADLVRDKTYLQQLDGLFTLYDEFDQPNALGNWTGGYLGSFAVPGFVRGYVRAEDPAQRNKWSEGGGPAEGVGALHQMIYRMYPSKELASSAKLDMWGNELAKDGGTVFADSAADTAYRMLMPVDVRQARTPTNYERMLFNYYRNRPQEHMPQMPKDTFTWNGAEFRFTPDEYREMVRLRGTFIQRGAGVRKWNFDNPSFSGDIAPFKSVMEKAGNLARETIIRRRLQQKFPEMRAELQRQRAEEARRVLD